MVCPSCQLVRKWTTMERHFQPTNSKNAKEMEQNRTVFMRDKEPKVPILLPATAKPVKKIGKEMESIQLLFGIEV